MTVLRSGGALEHYTSLREEAGRAEASEFFERIELSQGEK